MTEPDVEYYLWKAIFERSPRIELSQTEYEEIVAAKNEVINLIYFEEEWDSLIQNYITLESTLMQAALEAMVLGSGSRRPLSELRLEVARVFSNFLSSCRSYLDHAPHHLAEIGVRDIALAFKASTNDSYDREFAYRFLEALRNYAQHRGAAIHGTTFDHSWIGDLKKLSEDDSAKLRHWAGASIDVSKVLKDKKFKASVAAEVPKGRRWIDVIELTRIYVEELAGIHSSVRELIKERVDENLRLLRESIARYASVNDGNVLGLTAAIFRGGQKEETTDLFEDMLEWYEHLKSRNGKLVNLRKRYISNEILEKRKF